jgi:hypothetical protein
MFYKLFKCNQKEKAPVIGRKTELVNDATVYQYGAVVIDGKRYCAKVNNGAELCKGTKVEVLEENCDHGTVILTVKKV